MTLLLSHIRTNNKSVSLQRNSEKESNKIDEGSLWDTSILFDSVRYGIALEWHRTPKENEMHKQSKFQKSTNCIEGLRKQKSYLIFGSHLTTPTTPNSASPSSII